jgi:hypothetical protein
MKLGLTTRRACPSTALRSSLFTAFIVALCIATLQTASAQPQGVVSEGRTPLTTTQVVGRLVEMNLRRAQALHSFHGTRAYRVEYRGFLGSTGAEMVVDMSYRAPGSKEFTIRSCTGSKLIIEKVLRKLLQAEEEAQSADGQRRTALNGENYDFKMVGYESSGPRRMYVLAVAPKTKSKFLFRGRVWVDADDFAVARLEAEPARNPSFWTKSSQIEQAYQKMGDFWLPERNHSTSSMRMGGRADLTIVYQSYKITASEPVSTEPAQKIARSVDANLSQRANQH